MRKVFFLFLSILLIPSFVFAYSVQKGDTLSGIARQFNTTWQELWQSNPDIKNPNLIFAGQKINVPQDEMLILGGASDVKWALPLPTDNYDSFLTSPLTSSATTIYVNALPTGILDAIYTIFASDGTTPREKVYCLGMSASSNRLTSCVRGVSMSPTSSGTITEAAGTGLSHSKNARIAITDNINYSGKALAMLSGNQMTSSTSFILGTGVSTTLRIYFHNTGATSTDSGIQFVGGQMGYFDGLNSYTFAQGSSGLTASSTKGIGITDSKIHINASSTGGLEFNSSDGYLQVKTPASGGIKTDSTGTQIDTSDALTWSGNNFFTGNLNASSTALFNNLSTLGNGTSTVWGNLAVNYIGVTSTASGANATTTIVGNLDVNGRLDFDSMSYVKSGVSSQPINTTGNQVITHNLGSTPSFLLIESTIACDAAGTVCLSTSIGTATSTVAAQQLSFRTSISGTTVQSGTEITYILNHMDSGGGYDAYAQLTAWDATTFTLNWTANVNAGGARNFRWTVYK